MNFGPFFLFGGMDNLKKTYRAEVDTSEGKVMKRTATGVAAYIFLWDQLDSQAKRDAATRISLVHEPSGISLVKIDRTKACEHGGEQAFNEYLESLEIEMYNYSGGEA